MSPVTSASWNQLILTYAICTTWMAILYWAGLLYGANVANHPKEDEEVLGLKLEPPDGIVRRERIAVNNVENIPLGLAVFWAAFIIQNFCNVTGNGSQETLALIILFVIYTGMRTLFVIFYAFALQPHRSIVFVTGWLSVIAAAAVMISSATQTDLGKLGLTK